jgi:Tfp pilus assembly protein PilP
MNRNSPVSVSKKSNAAIYGVGGILLVACLAAANMPSEDPQPSRDRVARTSRTSPDAIATEVQSQSARLRARMSQAPVPERNARNPFSFAPRASRVAPREVVHAANVADEPAPMAAPPPLPPLMLMGIAEEAAAAGPRRTAIIAGDGDALFMVTEGQPVGDRYKVTKIGADAVELEDLVSKGYRRLALR